MYASEPIKNKPFSNLQSSKIQEKINKSSGGEKLLSVKLKYFWNAVK